MYGPPRDRMVRPAPVPGLDAGAVAASVRAGVHDAHLADLRRRELAGEARAEVLTAIEERLVALSPTAADVEE